MLERLQRTNISCVLTTERLLEKVPSRMGILTHPDPKGALYAIHDHLFKRGFYGQGTPSSVAKTARVHPSAFVSPMNVTIGAGVVIDPHATVLSGTRIDPGAVIRSGSVIGADGFGVRRVGEHQVYVPHAGSV